MENYIVIGLIVVFVAFAVYRLSSRSKKGSGTRPPNGDGPPTNPN